MQRATLTPSRGELPPDLAHAVNAEVRFEDPSDLAAKRDVAAARVRQLNGSAGGGMRMIGRRGDRQNAADRLDPVSPRCSSMKAIMA